VETLPLRERKKLRTRQDLVLTALELFTSKGFDATTLDEIVERVEVSKRTFFRNFTSKEDVAFAPGKAMWEAVVRSVAERDLDGPVLHVLRDAIAGTIRGLDDGEEPQEWSLRFGTLHRLIAGTPALHAYGLEFCAGIARTLADDLAVRLGRQSGDLATRMLVDIGIAAWHLAADDWSGNGAPGGTNELAERIERTFGAIPESLTLTG
jgi:AcrR family transcriptional regulator